MKRKKEKRGAAHNCDNCKINQINNVALNRRNQVFGLRVRQNNAAVVISATPSDPNCPCVWDDKLNVEFIDIRTGLANQTRKQLLLMPQIIRQRKAKMSRNANHFNIAGCTLTINIATINRDLRQGNINGVPFNLKAVPLRIAGRVRCGKQWRKFLIIITD